MKRDLKAIGVLGLLSVLAIALWNPQAVRAAYALFQVTGSFNNSAFSIGADGRVGSCDPATIFAAQQAGNLAAYGLTGCTDVLSSSTNHEAGGVFGAVTNASPDTNADGGAFYAIATGNGIDGNSDLHRVRLWGINPLMADNGYSHVLMNNELDYNVTGPDTKIVGLFSAGASTHQPAAGSVWMFGGPIGTGIRWPLVFGCADAAGDICFQYGVASLSGASDSQPQRMLSRTSTGAINTVDTYLGQGGGLLINMSNTGGAVRFRHGGVDTTILNGDGGVNPLGLPLAQLGSPANFSIKGCTDCVPASNPCTIGGSGAIAKRLNGAWDCR